MLGMYQMNLLNDIAETASLRADAADIGAGHDAADRTRTLSRDPCRRSLLPEPVRRFAEATARMPTSGESVAKMARRL
jgi:hypothetical protein